MPARRREQLSMPRVIPTSHVVHHDYGIDDSISRAGYFSNAVLEDTYDAATQSRGKDQDLLRSANSAIISTEMHSTPRAAVLSRKARATSVPPRQVRASSLRPPGGVTVAKVAGSKPTSTTTTAANSSIYTYTNTPAPNSTSVSENASRPVALARQEAPWLVRARAGSVPPRARPHSIAVENSASYAQSVGTEGLKAHNPMLIRQLRARSMGPAAGTPMRGVANRSLLAGSAAPPGTRAKQPPAVTAAQRVQKNHVLSRAMARDIDNRLQRLVRSASEPPCDLDPGLASATYPPVPDVKQRALSRYLYAHRGRFGADSKPAKSSLADFPQVYVPKTGPGPSNRAKAAIIGSKMEAEGAANRKKRPRSSYAAAKYRETRPEPSEEAIFQSSVNKGTLQASRPPLPKPTERKAIRDVDGFTKPKNVMSWQYRVESRLSPDDLIDQPASFARMREQVREAQEKMDRHRQLMDRYLDKDTASSGSTRNDSSSGGRSSSRSYL